LAGLTYTADNLFATKGLSNPTSFDNREGCSFRGCKSLAAFWALTAPSDSGAIFASSGISHTRIGIAAKRTVHSESFPGFNFRALLLKLHFFEDSQLLLALKAVQAEEGVGSI
jgi:hypothetical protein